MPSTNFGGFDAGFVVNFVARNERQTRSDEKNRGLAFAAPSVPRNTSDDRQLQ